MENFRTENSRPNQRYSHIQINVPEVPKITSNTPKSPEIQCRQISSPILRVLSSTHISPTSSQQPMLPSSRQFQQVQPKKKLQKGQMRVKKAAKKKKETKVIKQCKVEGKLKGKNKRAKSMEGNGKRRKRKGVSKEEKDMHGEIISLSIVPEDLDEKNGFTKS